MRLSIPATLAALAALLGVSIAHNIQLGAHSRECFHEQLHADDKMTVSFQVGDREFGGSGNLEIDFWVSSLLFSRERAAGLLGGLSRGRSRAPESYGKGSTKIVLRGLHFGNWADGNCVG